MLIQDISSILSLIEEGKMRSAGKKEMREDEERRERREVEKREKGKKCK